MVRTYSARVDVYRNGARVTSLLFPLDNPPEITASASAAIKTGLRGTFKINDEAQLLTDELRPVQIIDGVEHPAGVFHTASYSEQISERGRFMVIEAYDKGWVLESTTTETSLHFAAGTNYIAAIEQLLTEAGISLRMITPTAATLATEREGWKIGTDYLTIINELLAEINYAPIWFDERGYAVIRPIIEPTAENIKHTYAGMDVTSVLSFNTTAAVDIFGRPNVFVGVCENPDLPAPLIATAENNSALSALSILRRGRRITRVYTVRNIASQAALQDYVNRLRLDSMMSSETLSISTANMPGHGIGDTVAVVHPEINGIYRETGWRLSLGAGKLMTHTLERRVFI